MERRTTLYSPQVTYYLPNNSEPILIKDAVSSSEPEYNTGEKVSVFYQSQDPTKGKVKSFSDLYMDSVITLILGLAFSLVGFFNIPKN